MLLNSILVYPNKNIVNNYVDYKSVSILVNQKKGMPVLYKRGPSFNHGCILDLILYLNILVYKLKQPLQSLQLFHVICK